MELAGQPLEGLEVTGIILVTISLTEAPSPTTMLEGLALGEMDITMVDNRGVLEPKAVVALVEAVV